MTPPVQLTTSTRIFNVPRQPQQQVDARDYIEKNILITVIWVNTIDDVIAPALKPSE